jgi:hypothetical protein
VLTQHRTVNRARDMRLDRTVEPPASLQMNSCSI